MPMVFGENGLEVAWFPERSEVDDRNRGERLSTGLSELDAMLGGGYFRGASILVTGAPGTAKTTLCGAFVDAACRRGESAVFVSFDSRADDIVRNMRSVSIDLAPHLESGRLKVASLRTLSGNAESVLLGIRGMVRDGMASCVVADPLSALAKAGNRGAAPGATERLIDWARTEGLTVMCTSLLEESSDPEVSTPMQISTIADTWINLTYVVSAGERNRGLSIIKSRGTSHSNQVRELVLSDDGVTLADVYTAGGEVLMGSMRWAREREEQVRATERAARAASERARLESESADLAAQISRLERMLESTQQEMARLASRSIEVEDEFTATRERLHERRRGSAQSDRGDDGNVR